MLYVQLSLRRVIIIIIICIIIIIAIIIIIYVYRGWFYKIRGLNETYTPAPTVSTTTVTRKTQTRFGTKYIAN